MFNLLHNKLTVLFTLIVLVQIITWIISQYYFNIPIQSDVSKNVSINLAVGMGASLTLFCCYLWLLSNHIKQSTSSNYLLPLITSIVFTLLALPFGMMLGIIGGGTLGGGYMAILFDWLNFNQRAGISLGITLGIFAIAVLPTLVGTVIGLIIGKLLQSQLNEKNA